jgi:hypothetical protein
MRNDPSDISKSSVSSAKVPKTVSLSYNTNTILKVVIVVVLMGLSFWAGSSYGNHHAKTVANAATTASGRGAYGRFSNGGGFGTVSAISSSSITVQNSRSGTSKTFAITSSTKITDSGQSATAGSIATGDRVIVIPSSSNSSDAASIMINPSFGGGFGGGGGNGPVTNGSSTSGGSSTTSGSQTISGSVTTQ